ncbi:uncharacterized protein LOC128681099 [Plodia interpunctella]|uniref:uncharacterized protein LOC128681099 n=1 Tax=Plodia interpunctella TaxID=58824 RepID=UPI0023684235|nr:uncharacterized protein LOC128681099 [Plodia interpunctella]
MARILLCFWLTCICYKYTITIKLEPNHNRSHHPDNEPLVKKPVQSFELARLQSIVEANPYMVALLNNRKYFHCTGVIVSKRAALTASKCIDNDKLKYIGVGLAFVDPEYLNDNALKAIDAAEVFGKAYDHEHSKVGIVYSVTDDLDKYFGRIDINRGLNFYDRPKMFSVFGYGVYPNFGLYAIQTRLLYRRLCSETVSDNATVCGVNYFDYDEHTLGKGGVVIIEHEAVAITGWTRKDFSLDYNLRHVDDLTFEMYTLVGRLNIENEIERMEKSRFSGYTYLSQRGNGVVFDKRIMFLLIFAVF